MVNPVARWLAGHGVSPDTITIIGTLGVMGGALGFFPRGEWFWGTMVVTAFVFSDMLDGAVARYTGRTGVWGAFLDSSLDRLADSAVFAGLIWWFAREGKPVLLGLCIFCLIAGNLVSYTRARAEGLGMRADVGVAERTERTMLILVATGLSGLGIPFVQAIGLWLLAVGSAVTVVQRFAVVYRQATSAITSAQDS